MKYLLVSIYSIVCILGSVAQVPEQQKPPRLVNDFADLLSDRQENALERMLVDFNDTTSTQIAVVTLSDLGGYDRNQMAAEIGHKWKVGQKGFDNGVVLLVKPKTGSSDRGQTAIQVGYGIEPLIPDAIAKRIVEQELIPNFKNGNYYEGILDGVTVIMSLVSGQFTADQYRKNENEWLAILPFLFILLIIYLVSRNRRNVYTAGGRSSSLPFWTALWLGSSMGSSRGGGWGGFSGGSGGFGGGGGFGGFGGGGFGGGGAGGSW